ncbi:MAG TPA: hypothetical protein DCF45_07795, partial [Gammaproteobacteria bacterium]|nr:hypothetical protein [Gammaproteobacteria bacterium]
MLLPRDYVRSCALGFGDKTAFVDGDIRRSFADLDRRSDRLAAALQDLGIKKGDVVAILAHDLVEVIEHFYACMKIGAVRVGINWRYAPREMVHLVNDCQPKVIVIQDNCIPLLGDQFDAFAGDRTLIGLRGDHGLELDFETLATSDGAAPVLPELSEDDRIAISYTSG